MNERASAHFVCEVPSPTAPTFARAWSTTVLVSVASLSARFTSYFGSACVCCDMSACSASTRRVSTSRVLPFSSELSSGAFSKAAVASATALRSSSNAPQKILEAAVTVPASPTSSSRSAAHFSFSRACRSAMRWSSSVMVLAAPASSIAAILFAAAAFWTLGCYKLSPPLLPLRPRTTDYFKKGTER